MIAQLWGKGDVASIRRVMTVMYRLLLDTEQFLLLKQAFVRSLDKEERTLFQPGAGEDA